MAAGVGILAAKSEACIADINLCGVVVNVLVYMIPVIKVGRVASHNIIQAVAYIKIVT